MATTSPLGIRYPPLTGVTPNVPRDLQNLAEDVQSAIGSLSAALQEGVMDAGSFEVTQASGGAGMTLDIASNVGSGCWVDDDGLSPARIARYYVPPTASKSTVTVATAHATLPRVDAVVVSMAGVVSIVTGTAMSGATLDNARDGSHGGAAIPSDSLHLADALVPATDTTISNSQIRDRRKWARGYHRWATYTVGFANRTSSTFTAINSTLDQRAECSGAPVVVTLDAGWFSVTADRAIKVDLMIDGVAQGLVRGDNACEASGDNQALHIEWRVTPTAGSHLFTPAFASADGTTQVAIGGDTSQPLLFAVEERLRQNTVNNITTSG